MNTRKYSKAQEKSVAKAINGRTQINSGATPFYKGDVKNEYFLVECKTCIEPKKSFAIKQEWLTTIKREAFEDRKLPALAFNFGDNVNYYILTERDFKLFNVLLKGEENES